MKSSRPATLRCIVCGREGAGVIRPDGRVTPHGTARPGPYDPIRAGLCVRCAKVETR